MKFSYKILLSTIIVVAAAFGISGYFFVNYVFEASMEREIGQAMDDSSILQFAFETAALNIPSKYDLLQDKSIEQIGSNLENSGQMKRLLRISDENRELLYASDGFWEDADFLLQVEAQTKIYQIVFRDNHYYVRTGTSFYSMDRTLYLETMRDVTEVYEERREGFIVYRQVTLIMLVCISVIMCFIAALLTKPIRLLTKATKKMADGDYSYRAKQISSDELGQLTRDFNQMANSLEENILEMEDAIRAREDFVAAFSHELKTPLTSIIGYADLLRSRKLDDEKHFMSANYIYTEGKRLETMAFRLLDIIVTKREDVELQNVEVKALFQYLKELYAANKEVRFAFRYEKAVVHIESNLLKSVLLNLIDNACKASEPGGVIEVYGKKQQEGYLFAVRDYGVGIAEEECKKITEAFYMVDKSRSRSRNGAGLGLALCVEILKLHQSELMIESRLGEGSTFSFVVPYGMSGTEKSTEEEKDNA